MKKNKRAYLDDFVLNEQGKYEYKGIIYNVNGSYNNKYLLFRIVGIAICIVIAGIVPFSGSMHAFYIIFPYVFEVVLAALLVYAYVYFFSNIKQLREYIYQKSFERFKPYTSLLIGNCGLSFICTIVYSLFNGFEIWAIVYVLLQILTFILTRQYYAYSQSLEFEKKTLK